MILQLWNFGELHNGLLVCCRHECPITADYALALASIPFITDPYDVFNLDTNFLDDGTVQVLAGILSNFSAGVSSLNEMTSSVLGLEHALYCPGANIRFRPTKPSLYQNARGVWILNELVTGLGGEPIEVSTTTLSLHSIFSCSFLVAGVSMNACVVGPQLFIDQSILH